MKFCFCFLLILCFCAGFAQDFQTITAENGLPDNYITSFGQFQNAVWIGTSHGLARYESGSIKKTYSQNDGLYSSFITDILEYDKSLYVFSIALAREKNSAINITADGNTFKTVLPPENFVITTAVVWNEKIWIASWQNGIYSFDPSTNEWKHYTTDDGLVENSIISMHTTDGYLFAGSLKSGFSKYDGITFTTYNEHLSELINNTVSAIYCIPGRYYFGTHVGISIYTPDASEKAQWISYTSWGKKLISNYIKSIFIDNENAWFGTNAGITWFNTNDMSWKSYTIENGLTGNQIFVIKKFSDELWFGTDKGISILKNPYGK